MGVRKRYLVICLMLLLMMIGGVAASEDASDDAVKTSGDNATLAVENEIVEEDNLALDGGSDPEEIESANDTNVLGASDEKDVLAATVDDRSVSGTTITALETFLGGNQITGADVILTKNYVGTADTANGISVKFLSITGDLNGNGGEVTLDMGSSTNHRFFQISSGSTVTFKNIIFKNACRTTAAAYGGAIIAGTNSNVYFINCTFENNYQIRKGGAIYFNTGCYAEFTDCTFIKNHLNTDGDGIDDDTVGGGAIHFQGNTDGVKFTRCTFDSNYAVSHGNHNRVYGGAIIFEGQAKNTEVVDCTFIDNNCRSGTRELVAESGHRGRPKGAAIYFKGGSDHVLIDNTEFSRNTLYGILTDDGGGAAVPYATYAYGGALCFEGQTSYVTIKDCPFDHNNASSIGRQARTYGGAIAFLGDTSHINISDSDFTNNAIYCSIYLQNDANYPNYAVQSFGGAIYFETVTNDIEIEGCKFDNNHAYLGEHGESMSGAIYLKGTSLEDLHIKDSQFSKNTADGRFGVINFDVPVTDCSFINVTFDNNHGHTAPLYFGNSVTDTFIINSTFTNNENTELLVRV